ncbi:hypothetical protein D3C84_815300 [compost metagenome]
MPGHPRHLVAGEVAVAVFRIGEAVLAVEAQALAELALAFEQQALAAGLIQVDVGAVETVRAVRAAGFGVVHQLVLQVETVQAELVALQAIGPFHPALPGHPGLRLEEFDAGADKAVLVDIGPAQHVLAFDEQARRGVGLPAQAQAERCRCHGCGLPPRWRGSPGSGSGRGPGPG